jgi:hypothetical protein
MSKKRIATRCLVIDASIARAAGSLESKHPRGILCRDFLMSIRSICHRIAWNDAIKAEWDKHNSSFAQQWRLSMLKLNKLIPVNCVEAIRDSVENHCDDPAILALVLKDCHLVQAALATDHRIASLDDQVRGHFTDLAEAVKVLRPILWLNPAVVDEAAVEWLERGAPDEQKRRLKKT